MGSRITVKLPELLGHILVRVEFTTPAKAEQTARVTFKSRNDDSTDGIYYFDVDVHEGRVELSTDFNFFRAVAHYQELMRLLYEHGICFTVTH